jgi:hypothetical protein
VDDKSHAELRTYLRRLGWALGSLPKHDRDEIVEETLVHVAARADQGQQVSAVLAALGTPEAYARSFIDEMEIADALAGQRPVKVLTVVLRFVHRSLAAALAFLFVLFLAAFAAGGLIAAVAKPFDPDHVGLWASSRGEFFFGFADNAQGRHEVLGTWIYLLAPLDLALAWYVGRITLLGALRRLRRSR